MYVPLTIFPCIQRVTIYRLHAAPSANLVFYFICNAYIRVAGLYAHDTDTDVMNRYDEYVFAGCVVAI